jgi:putative endonuclease
MGYCVYILANQTHTVLYTGVTNDLVRRVSEHRQEMDPHSFTAKYRVHKLVYYESTSNVLSAIEREKQIKSWSRKRKNALIEQRNPNWEDLYQTIL